MFRFGIVSIVHTILPDKEWYDLTFCDESRLVLRADGRWLSIRDYSQPRKD